MPVARSKKLAREIEPKKPDQIEREACAAPRVAPRGLVCGQCGHGRLRVLYTRGKPHKIVRRRECRRCGARITTWERTAGPF